MKRRESVDRTQSLKENKGSAIVMVLVVIAFISILVSVMYYRSILNYQMKMVDYKAKDNFYTAESAMDEIRTGLQSIASNAIAEAYVEVMQQYDDYNNEGRKQEFTRLFFFEMENSLMHTTDPITRTRYYKRDILKSFVTDLKEPGDTKGAELIEDTATPNELVLFEQAVVLRNVKLAYTDSDGYVSIINTDIRIDVPAIDFNEAFMYPDILDFSIIADDSLVVNQGNTTEIQGNIYAGINGIAVGTDASNAKVTISNAELVVTDGTISVSNDDYFEFKTAAGESSDLWAKGIEVKSGEVKVNSTIHVADDTTVNGKSSQVTYAGAYYGFGEEKGSSGDGSEGSSSILINGIDSSLDFSGLKALTLAGNAYISISGKGELVENVESGLADQADRTKTGSYAFTDNIIMGESIAVKSDQLAYLVPAECIGYYGDNCILGSNPVSKTRLDNEFVKAWNNAPAEEKPLYQEVNMDKLRSINNLQMGDVSIRKLFKIEKEGVVLVYYYMVFNDASVANNFFEEYYEKNKDKMDAYISKYVSKLDMGNYEDMSVDIAGNIMRMENNGTDVSYILEKDTFDASNSTPDYMNTLNSFKDKYLSFADEYKFENVVDKNIYENPVPTNLIYIPGTMYTVGLDFKYVTYGTDMDPCKAAFVRVDAGKSFRLSSLSDIGSYRVVVADGDVIVDRDYIGIIIASGKVTIMDGKSVTKDEEGVAKAMQLTATDTATGNEHHFIDVFQEGNPLEVTPGGPGTGNEEHIKIEELVGYSNWSKQ